MATDAPTAAETTIQNPNNGPKGEDDQQLAKKSTTSIARGFVNQMGTTGQALLRDWVQLRRRAWLVWLSAKDLSRELTTAPTPGSKKSEVRATAF